MGRVIKHDAIAIRCEVATPRGRAHATVKDRCTKVVPVVPVPASAPWQAQIDDLRRLVAQGWAFVLTPQLRAYCPEHQERVWDCSCRTNPTRAHLCSSHGEAKDLVWDADNTPEDVAAILQMQIEFDLSDKLVAS